MGPCHLLASHLTSPRLTFDKSRVAHSEWSKLELNLLASNIEYFWFLRRNCDERRVKQCYHKVGKGGHLALSAILRANSMTFKSNTSIINLCNVLYLTLHLYRRQKLVHLITKLCIISLFSRFALLRSPVVNPP